ncbi:NUDIX hydrolase [Streptomyces sp. NPDC047123]|uniref:NUDIX hydrolase n=1 Tax=Streptomyces sp. NPDC047123 TaxID=3155622 RepID=UPI0034005CD4
MTCREHDHDGKTTVRAAGCVLWRPAPAARGGIELALVHRPKWSDWSHPKGKLKRAESAADAARREVLEETGMRCVLGPPLSTAYYRDAHGHPKEVRYWAAEAVSGAFAPNSEVSHLDWLTPQAARHRLTHPRDVDLLDELLAVLHPAEGDQ